MRGKPQFYSMRYVGFYPVGIFSFPLARALAFRFHRCWPICWYVIQDGQYFYRPLPKLYPVTASSTIACLEQHDMLAMLIRVVFLHGKNYTVQNTPIQTVLRVVESSSKALRYLQQNVRLARFSRSRT